jgi:tetratricopeptide (TPR) repeat protein
MVGDRVESKRLLIHVLKLWRERGSDSQVADALIELSDMNRLMDLPEEGIPQAKEALEIHERLGDTGSQAECLIRLGWLFKSDNQLDAAEEAALRVLDLLPETGEQYWVCSSHRLLGEIYESKGEIKKAIHHYELALGIASTFNWHFDLFWVHYKLAGLFRNEGRLDDANAHIERAKLHTIDSAHNLGCDGGTGLDLVHSSTDLKRRGPRLCARPRFTRSLGLRRDRWRTVESFSRR